MKLWSSGSAKARQERREAEWTPEEPARRVQPLREYIPPASADNDTEEYEQAELFPDDAYEYVTEEYGEIDLSQPEDGEPLVKLPEDWDEYRNARVTRDARDDRDARAPGTARELPSWVSRTPQRRRRWPLGLAGTGIFLAAFYCVAVFSQIPFVAKWRAIYIETAMGTMTHQWLATAFIPRRIIEDTMYQRWVLEEAQPDIESDPNLVRPSLPSGVGTLRPGQTTTAPASTTSASSAASTTATTVPEPSPWENPAHPLYLAFPELDVKSFAAYAMKHEADLYDSDGYLIIDQADVDARSTGILTTGGDPVLAVDTRNGIFIVRVTGEGYVGRLAIVYNPAQVGVATAPSFGDTGSILSTIVKRNDGVLGINASGFEDPDGHGNGGLAYGLVLSGGTLRQAAMGDSYKTIGFDEDNRLLITSYKKSLKLRDAVEFKPALVVDGKKKVSGSAGWGIQPRTAIGQTAEGAVLLLVVDGRQTHSLGCTVGDLADLMLKYGAVQACNLDGGSSSVMYYNGREISQPSAADKKQGRRLPNAFLVSPAP